MDIVFWIGVLGSFLILVGFLLRRSEEYGVGTPFFQLLNLVGALLLLWYALDTAVWPFVALNVVWGFDAAYSLIRRFL